MNTLETHKPKIENNGTRIIINDGEMAIDVNHKSLASLFAAAPDMLEALLRLTHPMADDDDVEFAYNCIRRARGFSETSYADVQESCRDKEAADRIGGNRWANI